MLRCTCSNKGIRVVLLCVFLPVCLSVCLSVYYQYICSPGEIQVLVYASVIVRIHYLEASKASNERRYSSEDSFEGKLAHSGSLYNLEFHLYYTNDDSRTGGQATRLLRTG